MTAPIWTDKQFDLGFGNSVCVREAFMETVGVPEGIGFLTTMKDMMEMDYPTHEGDPEVVEITNQVIKRQLGKEYKHVFITNGATGGVVLALRAYAKQGKEYVRTRKAPWYGRYPGIIDAAGLIHDPNMGYMDKGVILLDLPSNPKGELTEIDLMWGQYPVILDAVYYNNVYCRGLIRDVHHDVLVGSYSKLFGINGIRLGWLATNNDLLAARVADLITAEYCGLSTPSTTLLKRCWERFNWHYFEQMANIYLNCNREEWSKLEKFFGDTPVSPIGMFYYGPMDETCKKLMNKAGIHWTPGPQMGTFHDNHGRFNIGQDNKLIRDAVKAVLKADKSK